MIGFAFSSCAARCAKRVMSAVFKDAGTEAAIAFGPTRWVRCFAESETNMLVVAVCCVAGRASRNDVGEWGYPRRGSRLTDSLVERVHFESLKHVSSPGHFMRRASAQCTRRNGREVPLDQNINVSKIEPPQQYASFSMPLRAPSLTSNFPSPSTNFPAVSLASARVLRAR